MGPAVPKTEGAAGGKPREDASDFEFFVAELSTRLTGLPSDRVDAEVERALRDLVEFLGTDRATLLEISEKGIQATHSWARPPFTAYINPTTGHAEWPWY